MTRRTVSGRAELKRGRPAWRTVSWILLLLLMQTGCVVSSQIVLRDDGPFEEMRFTVEKRFGEASSGAGPHWESRERAAAEPARRPYEDYQPRETLQPERLPVTVEKDL